MGDTEDTSGAQERSCDEHWQTCWMPAITCKPIMPLERFTFKAYQPSVIGSVERSWSSNKQLAAVLEGAAEDDSVEQVGIVLIVENVTKFECGSLEVCVVGDRPLRVIEKSVFPCKARGR